MSEAFEKAVNSAFSVFGKPADYQGRNVLIIPKMPDNVLSFGETRINTKSRIFEVRISDIPTPKSGEIITFETQDYAIQGEPALDRHNLVWKIEVIPK